MSAARSSQLILARATGGSAVSRRQSLILGAGALGGALAASFAPLPRAARAEEDPERHGISAFGDLQYPPDFRNFDYVDPKRAERRHVLTDWAEHHLQSKLPHV